MATQQVATRVIYVRASGESEDNAPVADDADLPAYSAGRSASSATDEIGKPIDSRPTVVGHHKVTFEYDLGDVVEPSDCICNPDVGVQCHQVTFHHQLSATSSDNADSGISLAYGKRDDDIVTSHDDIPEVLEEYKKSKPRMSIGVNRRADDDVRRITSRSMSRRSCSLPDLLDLDKFDTYSDGPCDLRSSETESYSSAGSLSNILVPSERIVRKSLASTHLELSEPICGRQHLEEPCYVCFKDNEIYCSVCISVHNFHCSQEVKYIPDLPADVKRNMFCETERELKSIRERLKRMKNENVTNFEHLKATRKSYLRSVMKFKNTVLDVLDRVEKESLLEMDIVYNVQSRRLEENLSHLDAQLAAVDDYLRKIGTVDSDVTGASVIDVQEAAKAVKSYEDDIPQTHKNTTSVNMTFEPSPELLELLSSVEQLWKTENVETSNCTSPLPCSCDKPFQFRHPVKQKEFSARLSRWHFDREKCCITGCEFLPNGNLILLDNNNKKIKMFDKKYRYMSAQSLHSAPWDIAVIDAEKSVVSIPDRKRLQFINTHQKITLKNHVTMPANCWGVSCDKDSLYVSCWSPDVSEVLVTDLQGQPQRRINAVSDTPLHTPWFIRARDDVIYVSDWGTYMLSTVTVNGATVQKYRNSKLVGPLGLDFDKDSNVYVCGRDSNNIHQVSPEGELLQVLLSEKDGINQPLAVKFGPEGDRMIVTSWMSDKVQVFKFQ